MKYICMMSVMLLSLHVFVSGSGSSILPVSRDECTTRCDTRPYAFGTCAHTVASPALDPVSIYDVQIAMYTRLIDGNKAELWFIGILCSVSSSL